MEILEKISLLELSSYLPYDLKIQYYENDGSLAEVYTMSARDGQNGIVSIDDVVEEYSHGSSKPILRPLSDIPKFIDSKFLENNIVEISDGIKQFGFKSIAQLSIDADLLSALEVLNKLFKYHFDVFGLIEKGLAVDINTLENYE